MARYIVMIDHTDGCDRESWSPFYCPMFIADSEEEAHYVGQYELAHWMNEIMDINSCLPEYGGYEVFKEGECD